MTLFDLARNILAIIGLLDVLSFLLLMLWCYLRLRATDKSQLRA